MPEKFHSGTINTPALAALKSSVEYIKNFGVKSIFEHEQYLARILKNELKNIKNIKVYGAENAIGNVAFNIENIDSSLVAEMLLGFALRSGYHCAPLAHQAIGTQNTGAIRASFGLYNTKEDAYALIDAVNKAQKEL